MQKIKLLPPHEARKIAAGEVVERPANVVKELIENSIDADAKNITIYLESAGKKLIRVIDDGWGMSNEDALLCFEQHATSKINSIDDLNTLSTYGFRGEALSSISAISKITLITKERNHQEGGILLHLENGEVRNKDVVSCSHGTDIKINDIFYNVPARFKFLKKDESELRQIIHIFQSFCLTYKDIHFKLFNDNKLLYNCPEVQDIRSRIIQLWDYNFEQNLNDLIIEDIDESIKITGLVSNHQIWKFNKSQIFFFVNKRWIKNPNLSKAMIKGYINVLPKDKFPAAFVFISLPQDFIDVNVHPRKEEIQFVHPKKIENLIQQAVNISLENKILESNKKKEILPNTKNEFFNESIFLAATQTTFDFEQTPFFEPIDQINQGESILPDSKTNIQFNQAIDTSNINTSNQFIEKLNYKIIGQFKDCYILLEKEDGICMIDQHAAHERILYEAISNKMNDIAKVKLIFPIIINLTEQNLEILLPYFDFLLSYGIEMERFSKDQLKINSIPVYLKDIKFEDLINKLTIWIDEYQSLEKSEFFKLINDKLCAQMACKAAIKLGDKLNFEQISKLLEDLQKTDNNFACPHGRPTSWILSLSDIEKKFKRNYR